MKSFRLSRCLGEHGSSCRYNGPPKSGGFLLDLSKALAAGVPIKTVRSMVDSIIIEDLTLAFKWTQTQGRTVNISAGTLFTNFAHGPSVSMVLKYASEAEYKSWVSSVL